MYPNVLGTSKNRGRYKPVPARPSARLTRQKIGEDGSLSPPPSRQRLNHQAIITWECPSPQQPGTGNPRPRHPVRPPRPHTRIPPPLLVAYPADLSKRQAYQKPGMINSCPLPPAYQPASTGESRKGTPWHQQNAWRHRKRGRYCPVPPPPGPPSGQAEP